ncbi:MAG: hypothetical protein E7602_07925 [Ruminococcaceae bacterium]|nr:hypothetical protein [Oscillospiraceae bacterium]
MEWYQYVGIICGIFSLFFGFVAFFLYMKVRTFLKLLKEEDMEKATPIILEQNKKVRMNLIFCAVLGVVGVLTLIL